MAARSMPDTLGGAPGCCCALAAPCAATNTKKSGIATRVNILVRIPCPFSPADWAALSIQPRGKLCRLCPRARHACGDPFDCLLQRTLRIRHLVHSKELPHLCERSRIAEGAESANDHSVADKLSGLLLHVVPVFPQELPGKRPRTAIGDQAPDKQLRILAPHLGPENILHGPPYECRIAEGRKRVHVAVVFFRIG